MHTLETLRRLRPRLRPQLNLSTAIDTPVKPNYTVPNDLFEAKLGDIVGFVCGPGEFPTDTTGRVYGRITDQWGRHLRVKMRDSTFTTVHSFTSIGIGAYYLGRCDPRASTICTHGKTCDQPSVQLSTGQIIVHKAMCNGATFLQTGDGKQLTEPEWQEYCAATTRRTIHATS